MVAPAVAVLLFLVSGVISMSENLVATRERGDCVRSSTRDAPGVCVSEEALVVTRRGEALSGDEKRVALSRLSFGEERVGREVVLEDAIEAGSVGMVEEGLR